jgi:pimeloyl-ACP methyl ester carboxylesterase
MRISGLGWVTVAICFVRLGCGFGQISPTQDDDRSSHVVKFIQVDKDVFLEVLDWGGSGRPLVLLAGANLSAHKYDTFLVPKLIGTYRVYGITRRGFGKSSAPESGYLADRLGDDVLAVIDALKLDHPVLVGHSIAGQELSSIGSRHPEKVAGLIYLDAINSYSFYQPADLNALSVDFHELRRKLEKLQKGGISRYQLFQELLEIDLPLFRKDLEREQEDLRKSGLEHFVFGPFDPPGNPDLTAGIQRYTAVKVPVLAICAGQSNAAIQAFWEKWKPVVERSAPSAKFVILPDASHLIFVSNEEEVLREMNAFIAGLNKLP